MLIEQAIRRVLHNDTTRLCIITVTLKKNCCKDCWFVITFGYGYNVMSN